MRSQQRPTKKKNRCRLVPTLWAATWSSSLLVLNLVLVNDTVAFTMPRSSSTTRPTSFCTAEKKKDASNVSGVVELGDSDYDDDATMPQEPPSSNDNNNSDDDDDGTIPRAVRGPLFISQGQVDPDTLNPDFSDAKQTRVILYTMLSLLPVLFLIPFMLGRDFIPLDQLPPVEIN